MSDSKKAQAEPVMTRPPLIARPQVRRLIYPWAVVLVCGFEPAMSFADGELTEIVVTAQKREERLQDVPISISVLSGKSLDNSTTESIFDEINRVPGVVAPPISQIGATQIAIRGVAASGVQWAGASPIAYYLDGVPFGFVRSAFIPDSGAFDLARVEVLRGPQGTLYGANAEDGVVRVLSNEASASAFDLKARLLGSGTNGGGANGGGDVAINVPLIEDQLAIRAVVGYQDWSGWIDRPNEDQANRAQLRDYRIKIAYQPTDALSIDLSWWRNSDHYGAPPIGLPNGTAPDSGTTPEPIDSKFDAYGARISYKFDHFSVTSMTSYLYYNTYNELDLDPYGFGELNLHSRAWSRVASEELLVNSSDSGPWRWTAGAFYRDDKDTNWQIAVPADVGYIDFKDTSKSYAVFGQVGRRFANDQLELTLGVRQFHDAVSTQKLDPTPPPSYVSESFNSTTPRVVLSWYSNPDVTSYLTFSEGFRSGMPQYYTVTDVAPSFAALKPDKLYNYEAGTKADLLDHHLAVDAAVYYVDWRDVQQSVLVNLPILGQVPAQVNGSSARGPGIDLSVIAHPTEQLQIGGTFSWNDLTMTSDVISAGQILFNKGDRLNNSSKFTGSLFGNYTFSLGRGASGELSASEYYLSKQAAHAIGGDGLAYMNYGDNLFFAQAAFTVTLPTHWAVKLYGDNLTNEHGAIYGPAEGYAPTTVEFLPRPRPRTIGLEVDYHYR